MWYKGNSFIDHNRAREKLNQLIKDGKDFQLTEKRFKRTIKQNAYLHLIISYFALETGYTTQEVKQEIFKKIVNPNTFYDGQKEKIHSVILDQWRSTADLNTEELTLCIDRFRDYSANEANIYLPQPSDLNHLREIEIELENNKTYL